MGSAQSDIVLDPLASGSEGVSTDTTTVSIDGTGSASVPGDFSTSGSVADARAFGTSFDFMIDAALVVDTTAGPSLGAKVTDANIDRDNSGLIGVRGNGGNGLEVNEGLILGIDASGLASDAAWQLTGIGFRNVGGGESYTVVNRNDTSLVLTGSTTQVLDVTSLGLIVAGGTSDAELVSLFLNSAGTSGNNIRIEVFQFDVVNSPVIPEPSSLAALALVGAGLGLRRRRR